MSVASIGPTYKIVEPSQKEFENLDEAYRLNQAVQTLTKRIGEREKNLQKATEKEATLVRKEAALVRKEAQLVDEVAQIEAQLAALRLKKAAKAAAAASGNTPSATANTFVAKPGKPSTTVDVKTSTVDGKARS